MDEEPLYPDDATRIAMREAMTTHLIEQPGELTATALVQRIRANGCDFTERGLRLELSRMLGVQVRLNPNRTLTAMR